MQPILILYATREGHTKEIAEHLAAMVRSDDLTVELLPVRDIPNVFSLAPYAAVIIAASVHVGKHEPEMVAFLKRHADQLNHITTALVSVSLAAARAEDPTASEQNRAQAASEINTVVRRLLDRTHWRPNYVEPVAGALMYRKYNPFVRFMMKGIAKRVGASTDTQINHVFTNWAALDHRFEGILSDIAPRQTSRV